jgi:hypothetical protein
LLLGELNGRVQSIPLYCDNQSAVVMMSDHAAGAGGRKHIDTAYQFVRNRVMRKEIELGFVGTKEQLADMFTKALPASALEEQVRAIGLSSF